MLARLPSVRTQSGFERVSSADRIERQAWATKVGACALDWQHADRIAAAVASATPDSCSETEHPFDLGPTENEHPCRAIDMQ
jgi:hypothetical protein